VERAGGVLERAPEWVGGVRTWGEPSRCRAPESPAVAEAAHPPELYIGVSEVRARTGLDRNAALALRRAGLRWHRAATGGGFVTDRASFERRLAAGELPQTPQA